MDYSAAGRIAFRGIGGLIAAMLAAWILKATVVSVSQVASLSMSPTLDPQEYLLISRSSYRLRTPETFPLTSVPFPSISIDGWSDVQRGDIAAFLDPHALVRGVHPSQAQTYVKRCIAVPGDTVYLTKEDLWVRGTHDDSAATARYRVPNPRAQERSWFVPGAGDTLRLGPISREQLYRIARRDGHRVSLPKDGRRDDALRIDGNLRNLYVAEQDYFFVIGDSPDRSRDSRHWGLVPEKALVGEVLGVIWPVGLPEGIGLNQHPVDARNGAALAR